MVAKAMVTFCPVTGSMPPTRLGWIGLGYFIADVTRSGPGQLQAVTTACGMRIARNGSCVFLRDPYGPVQFRMA
jgi:hypothetical protein